VRAANDFSPACPQVLTPGHDEEIFDPGPKSEDCLYLNVWTPAASASEHLPVLVYVHAGAWIIGSSARPMYDGNALAKKGVVVVSANYRLGVFGWFAHLELTAESEHRSSGIQGALDQVAALQWVKNNIAQFGGDPNKITMLGQSAGCSAVNSLAASPLVKGLVRAGIGESCGSFRRMTTLAEAETMGAQFSKAIEKPTLAELRAMPAQDLLEASNKSKGVSRGSIVDGWFLPQDPYTIYSQGKQNDIPWIVGGTNDEGWAMGCGGAAPPDSLAAYTAWVQKTFGARADALARLYAPKTGSAVTKVYHDVCRDMVFAGIRGWAKIQATTGKSAVYIYRFGHNPPHPEGNGNNLRAPVGTVHSSEVLYVFNNLRMKDYPWTDIDRKVADMLSSYWANFAKASNPNGPGLATWPAYSPKDE
jgi:para-nitrobenzyl esterase